MAETPPPPSFAAQRLPVAIEDEMKSSFMDYAMSVIIARALPDVRDGLKPVHRRILYTQHALNNTWNRPFLKSARIVGDCMGKFHPHGDAAIYDALVRMAQDFSLRYPLADGQGNWGSIDNDPAAAMRYTEVRMTRLASEMMAEIEEHKNGRCAIVVTEIPYMVVKARLIEKVAELVKEKRLEGISDIRDESNRNGMRIVFELKKDAVPAVVQNNLYKMTALQSSFGVTMLAIVDNQPKILSLKDALGHFIEHRRDVVTRRSLFELKEARARQEIVEGLVIAVDNIDRVIQIIRAAETPEEAKINLIAEP